MTLKIVSWTLFVLMLTCLLLSSLVLKHVANLQSRVKKGKMTEEKFEKTMSLLQGTLDYESFRDVDMVIEVL